MSTQSSLIQIENLTKRFGNVQALSNVTLNIPRGKIVALLGVNGAGKTTLINHLLGRLKPDSGHISIDGFKPGSLEARQRIGAILQSTQMPETLTVREHVELFSSYYPNAYPIDYTLTLAGLESLQNRKFKTLSGGQKQRVFFALAICGQPNIVFLDEPTVGLDVQSRRQFWQCIKSLSVNGTSVLLTTHYLEEADALAEEVLLLSDGQIIHQGTCASLKNEMGGKCIRFKTPTPDLIPQDIIAVTHIQQRGQYTELSSQHAENTLKELFQTGIEISDLTVTQASLEEAFIQKSSTRQQNQTEVAA